MNLKQLTYFAKVVETGSITRAAAQLSIAQPALSRQVARLEEELGLVLLLRHARGVQMTDAGEILFSHATEILKHVAAVQVQLAARRTIPGGAVALGMTPAMAAVLGPPLIQRFRCECPGVLVRILEGFGGYLHEWLIEGALDAAIVYEPGNSRFLLSENLLYEDLVLIGPIGDPKVSRPSVPFRTLASLPLVLPQANHSLRRLIDSVAARQNVVFNVVVEVDSVGSLREMVRSGIGYTVAGRAPVQQQVREGVFTVSRLTSPTVKRRLTLTTAAQRPLSVAARTLVRLVRPEVRRLVRAGAWPGELSE